MTLNIDIELIHGSLAPLDDIKRVTAIDRVAACDHVGYIDMTLMTHVIITSGMTMVEMTVSRYTKGGSKL